MQKGTKFVVLGEKIMLIYYFCSQTVSMETADFLTLSDLFSNGQYNISTFQTKTALVIRNGYILQSINYVGTPKVR